MIAVGIVIGVVIGALFARFLLPLIAPLIHRQRIEEELRGDWWTRFERQFHEYAGTLRRPRDADQPG